MRFRSRRQLERYLSREVLGRDVPRKPVEKERRGPARDAKYRAWIRSLPSIVSGMGPCDACHTGSDGGMSMKASDYTCLPMTRIEHMEYHRLGKREWEIRYEIDCAAWVARLNALWRRGRNEAA